MRRIILPAAISLLCAACATTYEQPRTVAPGIANVLPANRASILKAAKRVLVADGFHILSFDESTGVMSTAPRQLRLTPAEADCGKSRGTDYLNDDRTTTRVSFGVVADDERLLVKASVEGEYKSASADQNITLTCVSRGMLEQKISEEIAASYGP